MSFSEPPVAPWGQRFSTERTRAKPERCVSTLVRVGEKRYPQKATADPEKDKKPYDTFLNRKAFTTVPSL